MAQTTFIGRKAELQWLEGFLKKAAGGQLQVVFIAGEAGAGKSSLVEKFIHDEEELNPTLVAFIGECNAHTGSGDPYLPFRQLLTSLITDPGEKKSATETASAKRTARLKEFVRVSSETLIKIGPDLIGIFVPGAGLLTRIASEVAVSSRLAHKLSEKVGKKNDSEQAKVNPDLDQEKIFEQYASVLKALSKDRTLILVLDDLQWADSGSLNLLFHLARNLKDSRVLLLGTYRPDDVALGRDGGRHPFESTLNELKRYHGDIVLDLSRVDSDERRAFTNDLIDSEPNHLLNLVWQGKYEQALEIAEQSLDISQITKNTWAQCWPHQMQGQIWFEYGEIDRALEELDASVRLAQEANASIHIKWYSANLSWAYVQIGAVQKGMDLYRATRVPNAELPMPLAWNSTATSYALCEIATGQLDLAASTISARRISNGVLDHGLKLVQCGLALARKDSAQAISMIDIVLENIQKFKIDHYLSEALFLKGQAHLMNGERDLAKAAFEQARLAAEALGSRWLMWQILAALAGVESEGGKSSALKSQAREIIQFIADHMHEHEMRSQFLQSEGVPALMV